MKKFKKANSNGKGLSHPAIKVLIALNFILLGFGMYIFYHEKEKSIDQFTIAEHQTAPSGDTLLKADADIVNVRKATEAPLVQQTKPKNNSTASAPPPQQSTADRSNPLRETISPTLLIQAKSNNSATRYTVAKGLAHFHNRPDPSTKRKAFINHWNKAVLQPLDEKNGFIYIVYTNHLGQTSRGWLALKDLVPIPD